MTGASSRQAGRRSVALCCEEEFLAVDRFNNRQILKEKYSGKQQRLNGAPKESS